MHQLCQQRRRVVCTHHHSRAPNILDNTYPSHAECVPCKSCHMHLLLTGSSCPSPPTCCTLQLAGQHHKYCFKAGAILGRSETQELLEGPLDAARSQVTQTMFQLRDLLRPPGRLPSVASSSTGGTGGLSAAAAVPPPPPPAAAAAGGNACRGVSMSGVAAVAPGAGLAHNPGAATCGRALGKLAHELRWVWEEVVDVDTCRFHLRYAWHDLTSGLGPSGGAAAVEARGEKPPVSRAMSLRRDAKTLGEGSYGKVYLVSVVGGGA
jgi:hypothetical protein